MLILLDLVFFFVDGMFFGNPTEGDLGNQFKIMLRTCSEPVIGCFFIQGEVALKQVLEMPIKKGGFGIGNGLIFI